VLFSVPSQAKVSCVKINLENDQGEKYGDAETSL
jgi:hypothetical protein